MRGKAYFFFFFAFFFGFIGPHAPQPIIHLLVIKLSCLSRRTTQFICYYFLEAFLPFFSIGLPQHHRVASEAPQQSTITFLPQGTHISFSPSLILAMLHLLF
jgi:hypothetical protein